MRQAFPRGGGALSEVKTRRLRGLVGVLVTVMVVAVSSTTSVARHEVARVLEVDHDLSR